MSSSPLPIRRAGPTDTLSRSAKDALVVTPSGQLYGSTPGGTRIVYSREQLLSLASSPLSKTPPHIPAQISRSPEKSGAVTGPRSNGLPSKPVGNFPFSSVDNKSVDVPMTPGGASGNGGVASARTVSGSVTRSPLVNSARSPGSAFNFANGPVSPTNGMTQSNSFKERLAHAQQHRQQQQQQQQQQQFNHHQSPGQREGRPSSDELTPSSTNGAAENGHGVHGEEQFSMDM